MDVAAKIGAALNRVARSAARSVGLAAAIALALACVHFGTALAANVDNPVDPVTGLALPLKPFEKLHLMADGKCGLTAAPDDTWDRTSFNWQGACRFGLAHGWGYTINAADGKAVRDHFTYGWRDLEITIPTGYTKAYRNNRDFGGDYVIANFAGNDHFDPAVFTNSDKGVELQTLTGPSFVTEFVGFRYFPCPFKTFPEAPNYKPTKQQASLAKKACSKKQPGEQGTYIFEQQIASSRDAAGKWAVNAPAVQNVRVCEIVPSSKGIPTCAGEATYAAAPLMGRINEVMAADKTAVMDRQRELIARFAPLEVALNARLKAFAVGGNGR